MLDAFCPGATVNIDVSGSTQRVALGNAAGGQQVRICNLGTAPAWLAFGGSDVEATTAAGTPIPAGAVEVLTIPRTATHVAAIAAGATGKVYFTLGVGI